METFEGEKGVDRLRVQNLELPHVNELLKGLTIAFYGLSKPGLTCFCTWSAFIFVFAKILQIYKLTTHCIATLVSFY